MNDFLLSTFIEWAPAVVPYAYPHHYHIGLVILSYLVSFVGSYASLCFVTQALNQEKKEKRIPWLLIAAITAGGCAIWTMHFIGMMALNIGMDVYYDLSLTLVSMLLAILATGIGLLIIGLREKTWPRLLLAGLFMGAGIAMMHYTGMAAMILDAKMTYRPFLFSLSIAIAILASIAALWLFFNVKGKGKKMLSAMMMGIAVCGMHYTGIAAAVFTPLPFFPKEGLDNLNVQKADFILYIVIAIIFNLSLLVFITMQEQEVD